MPTRRMTAWHRKMRVVWQDPVGGISEAAARVRVHFAPRHGARRGTVGPVQFDFEFDLDRAVRRMYAGAYETAIVGLLHQILRPGDTFVDVGANIGYLSSIAAGVVGPSGRVISFEPAPSYFERLAAIRQLNPQYRWQVYQRGLGATDCCAQLAVSSKNIGWNSMVPGQIPPDVVAQTVSIPIRRLDDCLEEDGVDRVRLLKIDVEGYEGSVILGAEASLRSGRIDHLIVEVQPDQYAALGLDFRQVMGLLDECGYRAYATRHPHPGVQARDLREYADLWFRR
jgi:FkbM family methyltransferase